MLASKICDSSSFSPRIHEPLLVLSSQWIAHQQCKHFEVSYPVPSSPLYLSLTSVTVSFGTENPSSRYERVVSKRRNHAAIQCNLIADSIQLSHTFLHGSHCIAPKCVQHV